MRYNSNVRFCEINELLNMKPIMRDGGANLRFCETNSVLIGLLSSMKKGSEQTATLDSNLTESPKRKLEKSACLEGTIELTVVSPSNTTTAATPSPKTFFRCFGPTYRCENRATPGQSDAGELKTRGVRANETNGVQLLLLKCFSRSRTHN